MRIVLTGFIMAGKNIIPHKYLKMLTIPKERIIFSFILDEREFAQNSKNTPIKRCVMTNKVNTITFYEQKQNVVHF